MIYSTLYGNDLFLVCYDYTMYAEKVSDEQVWLNFAPIEQGVCSVDHEALLARTAIIDYYRSESQSKSQLSEDEIQPLQALMSKFILATHSNWYAHYRELSIYLDKDQVSLLRGIFRSAILTKSECYISTVAVDEPGSINDQDIEDIVKYQSMKGVLDSILVI